MRGFNSKDSCMNKTLDQLKALFVQNNISLTQGAYMSDDEENTKEHERCHALHANLTPSKDYLVDFGASNHMVSSRESFINFLPSGGPSSHMGHNSKIPAVERGLDKIHHDEFIPSPTENQIVEDEEEVEFSLQSIRIEENLLGVTPSPTAPKFYEISDISYSHMDDIEEKIQISDIE